MRELLRNRRFAPLLLGQSVSSLGTWVQFVGLNLYVYRMFGSGRVLGLFFAARMLPAVFFGPLGGLLADRFDRRRLLMAVDASRALLVLGYLFVSGLPAVFALGILLSALDKIFTAAHAAYLPETVAPAELRGANAWLRASHSVMAVLGPAVGGLLVDRFAFGAVFVFDAATFVVSVACLALVGAPVAMERRSAARGPVSFRPALAFLAGAPALLAFVALRFLDALGSGAYNAALPVHASRHAAAAPGLFGHLVAAWAAGEFIGSILAGRLRALTADGERRLFCLSVAVMAVGMGMTFRAGSTGAALAWIALGGLGDGVGSVLFASALMRATPAELRGRVVGSMLSLVYTTVAVGMALCGPLLDRFAAAAVTGAATLFILAAAALFGLRLALTKRRE